MVIIDSGIAETNVMSTIEQIEYLSQFYVRDELEQLSKDHLNKLFEYSQPVSVPIADLKDTPLSSYVIDSPDGYVSALEWRNKGQKRCVQIQTESGRRINCSVDHFFEMHNGLWKYSAFIRPGESLLTETGPDKVTNIISAGVQTVYDFSINHENHRYFTNGISSHNSGGGKSLFLANLGCNWALAGLNVLYLTFELSESLVAMRMDSMFTGISTREVFKNLDDVELRVKLLGKQAGSIQVKYMPSGKTANDLRAYIKEYQVKKGFKPDILLIDYLDLMMPMSVKVSPSDLFVKDKYVSEELRNLAMETQAIVVTASQLNRSSIEEIEFDHSHISGGLSKIQTADNVIGIFTSRAMKERGRYQIQFMKTRSSSGVGQKVDLEFDLDTLRIRDLDEDDAQVPKQTVYEGLKKTAKLNDPGDSSPRDPTDGAKVGKVRADIGSSKLREMIASLNSEKD
jgi:DnaB-like helicase C terminal domain